MPELIEALAISPGKVVHVIFRSRAGDVKAEAWDEDDECGRADAGGETIPEDLPGGASQQGLREFLNGLGQDEQASLIALAWIGRGTYAPAELEEAIAAAKAEYHANALSYLCSLPLLPDYLEDALDQLGLCSADARAEALRTMEA